ncbi:intermembrane transport protein PqiB [Uliginosibacterium sediminicola]|uniref:MlaD family protein n=1 Tax=Uliginosibacterium sediminicola TaxID=2024550 RepID=A0ABU9Z2K5_9RHOO
MNPQHSEDAAEPLITSPRWPAALVWLVPLLAALLGASILLQSWLSTGPEISIEFRTANGLEAGKTPVKYKDVTVGTVSDISLSEDGSHVIARVALIKNAASLAFDGTRFWVVRPRVGANGVSGIDTLLSGAYIGVDKGIATKPARHFIGLEQPPVVLGGMPGKSFVLHTDDLGSLDIGSPVYYRRIAVGRVAAYHLAPDGKDVRVQIFIDAPYDRSVSRNTRFWNASGLDVSVNADGFKLKTQSLSTIVAGGVAFATPDYAPGEAAAENAEFELSRDQESAMAAPDGPAHFIQLRFTQALRGLSIGAPVKFLGMDLGRVVSMDLDYDTSRRRFPTIVGILVYPQRLGQVRKKLPDFEGQAQQQAVAFLRSMVAQGLRAQARSGNLLTGQLYISLEFVANAAPVSFDADARPLVLPTVESSLDSLQDQLASVVSKLDRLPIESIGHHLDSTLLNLDQTLVQFNGPLLGETTRTLQQAQRTLSSAQAMFSEDAPMQQEIGQTLQDAQRSFRSLRALSELLSRQPESLLRGLPAAPPASPHAPEAPTP